MTSRDDEQEHVLVTDGGLLANAAATIWTTIIEPIRPATIHARATAKAPEIIAEMTGTARSDVISAELAEGIASELEVAASRPKPSPNFAEFETDLKTALEALQGRMHRASIDKGAYPADAHDAIAADHAPPPPPSEPRRKPRQRAKTIPVDTHFKLVFLSVLALTVLTGAIFTGLAVFVAAPTNAQLTAIETTRTLMIAGFGVIFGLLGGKTIQ